MPESSTAVDGASSPGPGTPEGSDASLLEQFQHRGVVDVIERIQITPAEVDRDVQTQAPVKRTSRPQSRVSLRCARTVRLRGIGAEALDLISCSPRTPRSSPRTSTTGRAFSSVPSYARSVRRDPVEEPPVVSDHHSTAGELEQGVLERAQGLDVEVVCRLIEEQQVAPSFERQREVQTVALTTGEHAGLLLLVRALEAELRHVRRGTGSRSCRR